MRATTVADWKLKNSKGFIAHSKGQGGPRKEIWRHYWRAKSRRLPPDRRTASGPSTFGFFDESLRSLSIFDEVFLHCRVVGGLNLWVVEN
jgi:hypothetical protein